MLTFPRVSVQAKRVKGERVELAMSKIWGGARLKAVDGGWHDEAACSSCCCLRLLLLLLLLLLAAAAAAAAAASEGTKLCCGISVQNLEIKSSGRGAGMCFTVCRSESRRDGNRCLGTSYVYSVPTILK
jgi:hypothetical protein